MTKLWRLLLALSALVVLIGARPAVSASTPIAVYVQGNSLVDAAGNPLLLHGVDRAGAEYNCMGGKPGQGLLDGPGDQASIDAMKAAGINAVRIPLNEDCLLGINAPGNTYVGAAYEQNLQTYVNLLTSTGIYTILDLHWNAPGTTPANTQQPMADMDHAPAFWREISRLFASNPATIWDLYNEPNPIQFHGGDFGAWQNSAFGCLRDGCALTSVQGVPYRAAGMQTLVDTIRATGAHNVLMVGGIQAAETITQLKGNLGLPDSYMPSDPLGQLAASTHIYPQDACSDLSCWNTTIVPVANVYPVVAGEVGESGQACPGTYTALWDAWAAAHTISTIGWTWNVWSNNGVPSCDSLITDYKGTPNGAYGQSFLRGLALFQSQAVTGTATPGSIPTIVPPTATITDTATLTATATLVPSLTDTATVVAPTNTPVPVPTNTSVPLATATAPVSTLPKSYTQNCYLQASTNKGRPQYVCVIVAVPAR